MKRKHEDQQTTPKKEVKILVEDIDELRREFYDIDEQILELESKRQIILNKLKEDSRTRVSFSNIRRYEKTKECLNSLVFLSISNDCMRIIFDFAFYDRLLDPMFVNALCRMTTSMREAMLNCNFRLDLTQGKYKINGKKSPPFKSIGAEFLPNSTNMKILKDMKKIGVEFESIIVRQDLLHSHSFNSTILEKVKKFTWIQSKDSSDDMDFNSKTKFERLCLILYRRGLKCYWMHSNHTVLAYTLVGFYSLLDCLQKSNHLTFFSIHCKSAVGNIDESKAFTLMQESDSIKKFVFIQCISKKKDPELSKSTQIIVTIFSKTAGDSSKIAQYKFNYIPLDFLKLIRNELDNTFDIDNDHNFTEQYVTFLKNNFKPAQMVKDTQ